MLTLPLAQSDNMLPSSQKGGKLRRFRMSQGFIEESERGMCSIGAFENDYSFLLQGLQVDNYNFEMGH